MSDPNATFYRQQYLAAQDVPVKADETEEIEHGVKDSDRWGRGGSTNQTLSTNDRRVRRCKEHRFS